MALPINVEDLLRQRKVESNRIEFKRGWNPERIYRTICGFANDFDNIGGGYILVGVEEENGVVKRPVCGLNVNQIDGIMKDMNEYNNKITPYYLPRTEVVTVDGVEILVIWCPSGINRPYEVSDNVTSRHAQRKCYIRSGSSTIEAKGYVLDELREMSSRVPFDDRGNPEIKLSDISGLILLDYLNKVGSKLASDLNGLNIKNVLEQMDLLTGPKENRMLKNVAAMMFCANPEKFFPYTQVEIVIFPDGIFENPRNIREVPPIRGTVPQMIEAAMSYLRTMVIQLHVEKQPSGPSKRIYNYPEKALEEALTNAFYHRDYQSRTPVVVEVQPYEITISSATGPDRSIPMVDIQQGRRMVSRYYRNRRLGEFLKELSLTEGRNTGIPTIQRELALNGSPAATFVTDEDRLSFLVRIPCHEGEEGVPNHTPDSQEYDTVSDKETPDYSKETPDYDKETSDYDKETPDYGKETPDYSKETPDYGKETPDYGKETPDYDKETEVEGIIENAVLKGLSQIQVRILQLIMENPEVTISRLAECLGTSVSKIRHERSRLEKQGIFLCRKGATKKGQWEIIVK